MTPAARRLRPRGTREPAQDLPRREGVRRDARAATSGAAVTSRWAEHRRRRARAAGHARPTRSTASCRRWVVRPGDVDGGAGGASVRPPSDGAALVASGLGAHLDIGAPPGALDVLLRLDRLDARPRPRGRRHDGDASQAGCTLARLDGDARDGGQWLPLDPPRPSATTVGGLIAANLVGAAPRLAGHRARPAARPPRGRRGRRARRERWTGGQERRRLRPAEAARRRARDARRHRRGDVQGAAAAGARGGDRRRLSLRGAGGRRSASTSATPSIRSGSRSPGRARSPTARAMPPRSSSALPAIEAEVAAGRATVVALVERRGPPRARRSPTVRRCAQRLGAFPVAPAAAVLRASVLPSEVGRDRWTAIDAAARERGTRRRAAWRTGRTAWCGSRSPTAPPSALWWRRCVPQVEARGGWFVVERAVARGEARARRVGRRRRPATRAHAAREACLRPRGLLRAGTLRGGL